MFPVTRTGVTQQLHDLPHMGVAEPWIFNPTKVWWLLGFRSDSIMRFDYTGCWWWWATFSVWVSLIEEGARFLLQPE